MTKPHTTAEFQTRWEKAKSLGWTLDAVDLFESITYHVRPPAHFACTKWAASYQSFQIDAKTRFIVPSWFWMDDVLTTGDYAPT